MNKIIKNILFTLSALSLLVGCNKNEEDIPSGRQEIPSSSLELSASKLTMEVYDSVLLTYTLTGSNEDVVWHTSNNKVATVNKGLVTALSLGSVLIAAEAGDLLATCSITIVEPEEAPVMHLDVKEVKLERNKTANVDLSVTYKGNEVDAEFGFDFVKTYPNNLDVTQFASFEYKDGKLKINSLSKYGYAEVLVHTNSMGVLLTKRIYVGVINTHYDLSFSNISKNMDGDFYLSLNNGENFVPSPRLNEDGVDTLTEEFVYYSLDENVVSVESNTLVTRNVGKTTLLVFSPTYSSFEKVLIEVI